jgi:hypothetical protein
MGLEPECSHGTSPTFVRFPSSWQRLVGPYAHTDPYHAISPGVKHLWALDPSRSSRGQKHLTVTALPDTRSVSDDIPRRLTVVSKFSRGNRPLQGPETGRHTGGGLLLFTNLYWVRADPNNQEDRGSEKNAAAMPDHTQARKES